MYAFLLLDVLFLWIFLRIPHKMTPYETVASWLVTIVLYDDWLTIVSLNLGLIETTQHTLHGLVLGLQRVLLFPLLGIFFLEVWLRRKTAIQKAVTFLIFVTIGVSLQILASWFELFHYVRWQIWWSFVMWFLGGLLLLGVNRVMKRLLLRVRSEV